MDALSRPGVVRVTTPRSVVRTRATSADSLLPLLIPASIAVAGLIWNLLRRRKPAAAEISVTVVVLVEHGFEATR
jgi:hypothetical protein